MRKAMLLASLLFIILLSLVKEVRAIDISACSVLDTDYGVYTLTADISNSTATYCMNISANHIIFDCQSHTIDGTDSSYTYGIIANNPSLTTNITIRNCVLTDWQIGIFLNNTNSSALTNITAYSNYDGVDVGYSSFATLTNITTSFNYDGVILFNSSYCNVSNSTADSNDYGIVLDRSFSNMVYNNIIKNSTQYGIYLSSSAGVTQLNIIYNNLFNNTNNYGFKADIYTNYWNTTRQAGARIYSNGTEIGGNYWTNSTGNGFSDTCADFDEDGFCDSSYTLNSTGPNIDYLPLSNKYKIPSSIAVADSPDPVTNSEGSAVTIWANYTDLEGNIITGSTCTVTIFGYNWNMPYSSANNRYEVTISTAGRTPAVYTYNITCSNPIYRTQSCNDPIQTVEVKEIVTGGESGGGGGGVTPAPANFTIIPEIYNVITYQNKNLSVTFRICNKDTRTIKLQFSPTGEYNYWVTAITYKGEGFLFQAVPAYGLPGKIDFLTVDPGTCVNIDVHVSVPEVPDSPPTYDIGIKANEITTSTVRVFTVVVTVKRGVGLLGEWFNALTMKLLWGIKFTPDVKKIEVHSDNLYVYGKNEFTIPLLGTALVVAASYLTWYLTRKKFKRAWLFAFIAGIVVLFIIP